MNTKYRLIFEDYKKICGKKLYRIEALKDFGDIKAGDLGGYIESEDNLSHDGNAWTYGNACVCDNAWVRDNAYVEGDALVGGNACVGGNARVYGNARVGDNACVGGDALVGGNARVCGNAWVRGNAYVGGNAWVYGNACVGGNAWVYGYARVRGNASWLIVGPIGSRDGFTTFVATADGEIHVSCGCFSGDIDEFEKAVEKTHAGTQHEKDYKLAIALAKSRIVTAGGKRR